MQPRENLLRRDAVVKKTGLSQAELYRQVADGEFPKPVKIASRAVAWVESEVDGWIAKRVAARDGVAA